MHIHVHTQTHIHTYTCAHTHRDTYTHTHNTHTHTHMHTYAHAHTLAHTHVCAHTHVHTHTCASACALEPEHCCGDRLGHCSVQLSPQRQVGACSDGFVPTSSEDGTEWPLAARPCSHLKQAEHGVHPCLRWWTGVLCGCLVGKRALLPLSTCMPAHTCPHMCRKLQAHTHTHTHTHKHTLPLSDLRACAGPLPWLRARPLL